MSSLECDPQIHLKGTIEKEELSQPQDLVNESEVVVGVTIEGLLVGELVMLVRFAEVCVTVPTSTRFEEDWGGEAGNLSSPLRDHTCTPVCVE